MKTDKQTLILGGAAIVVFCILVSWTKTLSINQQGFATVISTLALIYYFKDNDEPEIE
jgi:hypothetical protein